MFYCTKIYKDLFVEVIFREVMEMSEDTKGSIRKIIERLTIEGRSVFSEKVFLLAGELGIGELVVQDCLQQLIQENFISEPMQGVLRKV